LEATDGPLSPDATEFSPWSLLEIECLEGKFCPHCGEEMHLVDRIDKPNWRDIMASAERPDWYARDHLQGALHGSVRTE